MESSVEMDYIKLEMLDGKIIRNLKKSFEEEFKNIGKIWVEMERIIKDFG